MSSRPLQPADALSAGEAAHYCGVSAEAIRRWICTNGPPACNTELGLNIRIRVGDLEVFAQRNNILMRPRLSKLSRDEDAASYLCGVSRRLMMALQSAATRNARMPPMSALFDLAAARPGMTWQVVAQINARQGG